jgi:hypothetical protein
MAAQDSKPNLAWQEGFAASVALLTLCSTCGKETLLSRRPALVMALQKNYSNQ